MLERVAAASVKALASKLGCHKVGIGTAARLRCIRRLTACPIGKKAGRPYVPGLDGPVPVEEDQVGVAVSTKERNGP